MLLYLLLTGRTPHRVSNLPAREVERILTEEEPARPSDAVAMARQAADTARQRDLAEAERDKAEQVSKFLIDLFKDVDPRAVDGNTVTAREVLDRGVEKIDLCGAQPAPSPSDETSMVWTKSVRTPSGASRPEAKDRVLPSGEKAGKPSKAS